MVRVGEEDVHAGEFLDVPVFGEFRSVVVRHGLPLRFGDALEKLQRRLGHALPVLPVQEPGEEVPAYAFDVGEDGSLRRAAADPEDGVAFPVPDDRPRLGFRRSFADPPLAVGRRPLSDAVDVPLSAPAEAFLHVLRARRPDEPVNRVLGERLARPERPSSGNLFGRPRQPDFLQDEPLELGSRRYPASPRTRLGPPPFAQQVDVPGEERVGPRFPVVAEGVAASGPASRPREFPMTVPHPVDLQDTVQGRLVPSEGRGCGRDAHPDAEHGPDFIKLALRNLFLSRRHTVRTLSVTGASYPGLGKVAFGVGLYQCKIDKRFPFGIFTF